jgi:hypothetical protein
MSPPKRSGDDFNPKRLGVKKPSNKNFGFTGTSSRSQLDRPVPLKTRFRPAVGTKDFSALSDYNYASVYSRWRRGYELSMYAGQAYDGYQYSYRYYFSGVIGIGPFIPGLSFIYPTTRSDSRTWNVYLQPEATYDLRDFDLSVLSVTDYTDDIYSVRLKFGFSLPLSAAVGEVFANRYDALGNRRKSGFNNWTCIGIGLDGVLDENPSYTSIYNTLFLGHNANNSWTVVDENNLAVPATSPPAPGEYLVSELRTQCNCPDFLNREAVNFWDNARKMRYPYTSVQDMKPGFFDAGTEGPERVIQSIDDPGFARAFGFIYTNQIYNIPSYTQEVYSDPSLFYYQPKWCKHVYAAMWDYKRVFGKDDEADYWLPQPSDEPAHPAYREMFDRDLAKQMDFFNRERNQRWWLRYGPNVDELPKSTLRQDNYSAFVKAIHAGNLNYPIPVVVSGLTFSPIDQYNPIVPIASFIYDGGQYASGVQISTTTVSGILDGGTYASGVQTSPIAFPINGGLY